MDITCTIHLAGATHRLASEMLADRLLIQRKMIFDIIKSEIEKGVVKSNPEPSRPDVRHNDREMDSWINIYDALPSHFITDIINAKPDVSAIWYIILTEEARGIQQHNVSASFYHSKMMSCINTAECTVTTSVNNPFDGALTDAICRLIADVAGAQFVRFDPEKEVLMLTPYPQEVPQSEWMQPHPVFQSIINDFIPIQKWLTR